MNLDLIGLQIALGPRPNVQVHEASSVLPRFSFQGHTQIFLVTANSDFPLAEQLNQTAPLYWQRYPEFLDTAVLCIDWLGRILSQHDSHLK